MRPRTNRLLMLLIGAFLAGCASQTERSSSGAGANKAEAPAPAYEPKREDVQFIDKPLEEAPPQKPAPAAAAAPKNEALPDFPVTKYEIPPEEEVEDLGTQPDESGSEQYAEEEGAEEQSLVSEPTEYAEESEEEVEDLGTQPDESGTAEYAEEEGAAQQSLVSEPTASAEEPEEEVGDLGTQPDESGTMTYPEEQRAASENLISKPKVYAEAEQQSQPARPDNRPDISAPTVYADEAAQPKTVSVKFEAEPLFSFDKATIRADQRKQLDDFVASLRGVEYGEISAIGHADRIGKEAYNQKLSERRANAVKAYLVRQGVPAGKIRTEGRGESEPVSGDTCNGVRGKKLISCLQPDRRVDVSVSASKRANR